MDSVLFLAAHPDDVACGMAGVALLLKGKYVLRVLCLTKGERGLVGVSMEETARMREKEEREACIRLSADLRFMNRIDGEVVADREICEAVADEMRRIVPAAIFTMWPVDYHPDHSAAAEIALKASFLANQPVDIFYCEQGANQTRFFSPDTFFDITGVIGGKMEIIRCHVCQNPEDAMAKEIFDRSISRGFSSGFAHAEAFRVFPFNKEGTPHCLASLPEARIITL